MKTEIKSTAYELRKAAQEELRSDALNRYIDEVEGEIDRVHKHYMKFAWRVFTVMAIALAISVTGNAWLGFKYFEHQKPAWGNKK